MGAALFLGSESVGTTSGKGQARLALARLLPAHLAWELTPSGGETE